MFEAIWLSGLAFGAFWGSSNLQTTPIPLQPWVAEPFTDRTEPRDSRVPILPAIKPGERPTCDEPPDKSEILRALPKVQRGVPYVYEERRDDVEFTVEKLVDRVDPPRFFPLIGPAQLHHCHWKCTVYFTEHAEVFYPWPVRTQRKRTEVVYIDKDHLHLVVADQTNPWEKAYCPGGRNAFPVQKNAPRSLPPIAAAKAIDSTSTSAPQVFVEITVAKINRSVMPKETYRWAEKQFGFSDEKQPHGIVKDQAAAGDLLQALRGDGLVKILDGPSLTTVSGLPFSISHSREVPVTITWAGEETASIVRVGNKIEILPTVQPDGKIHLDFRFELSSLEPVSVLKYGVTSVPGVKRRSVQVRAAVDAGQALAIRGPANESNCPIAILADLPFVGQFMAQETEQEVLILVTPRLVNALPAVVQAGHAEESEPAGKAIGTIPTAEPDRRQHMTISDVARMAKKGIAQEIILRQMELTGAVFNLTVDDIIELHDSGVSEAIIRAMQERRAGNASYSSDPLTRLEQMMIDLENLRKMYDELRRFWRPAGQPTNPTPYRIRGGVGPASSSINP